MEADTGAVAQPAGAGMRARRNINAFSNVFLERAKLGAKEYAMTRFLYLSAWLAIGFLGSVVAFSAHARAQEYIVIENQGSKWKKLGGSPANPLIVDVKKGDMIEIRITGPHGFVTLDKKGNESPSPALNLVLACGEDPKPTAVLREVCSRFKQQLAVGQLDPAPTSLVFQVMDSFQADVHFWCIVHLGGMWGTFRLTQ
jgi:hypothetical protein